MATLTETAYYARKFIKWGSIGFVVFIILRLSLIATVDYIKKTFPPPPLKPNYAFGKLPQIKFDGSVASASADIKYSLQTVSGGLPKIPDAAYVYFMPKNRINLLSLSKAQTFVGKLNFISSPRQISDTIYRWIDLQNPLRIIEMDIVSNHFTLTYAYANDLTLFEEKEIPSPQEAIKETFDFLDNLEIDTTAINNSIPKTTYLKLTGDKLELASSQSQADAVRIDLFRKNYQGLSVYSEKITEGFVTVILSGSRRNDRRILSIKYNYWPTNDFQTGIYKLKTPQIAWEELVSGKAYIALKPNDQNRIAITNVYLAYFDSIKPQLYLQPIFVFTGEDKFLAFVPAVAPPWTE